MSKSINKVILIGNVGQDPEVRPCKDSVVANISIATSKSYKNKEGEKVETTEWHRLVVFGKLAEIVQKYVKKGSKIYIEGELKTRKWQDKEGMDRYTTEIVVNDLSLLGGGNIDKTESYQPPASKQGSMSEIELDDDIPF